MHCIHCAELAAGTIRTFPVINLLAYEARLDISVTSAQARRHDEWLNDVDACRSPRVAQATLLITGDMTPGTDLPP